MTIHGYKSLRISSQYISARVRIGIGLRPPPSPQKEKRNVQHDIVLYRLFNDHSSLKSYQRELIGIS